MSHIFDYIQRTRHRKGFGVHSPFAFDLITKTIYEKNTFNAFFDIEEMVEKNGIDIKSISPFSRLVFRLIHRFEAENVLEIHSGNGIDTLYILAPDNRIRCTCIEESKADIAIAEKLLKNVRDRVTITDKSELESVEKYDAICIHLSENREIQTEQLFAKSHNETFWIIDGINSGYGKQFWTNIVNDERTRVTFDMKYSGIIFLNSSYHKLNYLI